MDNFLTLQCCRGVFFLFFNVICIMSWQQCAWNVMMPQNYFQYGELYLICCCTNLYPNKHNQICAHTLLFNYADLLNDSNRFYFTCTEIADCSLIICPIILLICYQTEFDPILIMTIQNKARCDRSVPVQQVHTV